MTVSIYYYSLFFIQLLQNLQYPHTIFLMWNAQGQLSAPILSFRSCASRSGANGEWERHLWGILAYPCLFHRVAPETIFCLADMGTTPSSSRPKEETSTNGGFFSNLWLCGGGDAIDENSTERSRRRVASADKETDGRKLRAGADDAKRVTESTESAS